MKASLREDLKHNILHKGILLVFILLIGSGGSNTFSGSIKPDFRPSTPSELLFSIDKQSKYFALFPNEVLRIRRVKEMEQKSKLSPTPIIYSRGVFSSKKLAAYLKQNNPKLNEQKTSSIAQMYIEEAKKEGINHDIAFSQMCLETGFLKFGGDVDPEQNNFCGLGVTGGGVKGLSFEDERSGIRAHIQHLKAYASTDDLNLELVDQRFHYVKRGIAKKVDDLAGKWAMDKHYGNKITNILSRIENFQN